MCPTMEVISLMHFHTTHKCNISYYYYLLQNITVSVLNIVAERWELEKGVPQNPPSPQYKYQIIIGLSNGATPPQGHIATQPHRPIHSAESTKQRVSEIFRCFLGLNKLLVLLCFHLVTNLEIILQNVFSSYEILVKFLDSLSTHALKVAIF